MKPMNPHTGAYAQFIQRAKTGDSAAGDFLRRRLKSTADAMPAELLISLSEMLLEYRVAELRSESELN